VKIFVTIYKRLGWYMVLIFDSLILLNAGCHFQYVLSEFISYVSGRVICLLSGSSLDQHPPNYAFCVAGITDVHHYVCLVLLR
jgi:hypothetical protein